MRPGYRLLTSAPVIGETVSLLQIRNFTSLAIQFLASSRMDEDLQIIYPDPAIQTEAWDLFIQYASIGANAVDCVSFAIMRSYSIKKAFAFDQHFRAAGFDILS